MNWNATIQNGIFPQGTAQAQPWGYQKSSSKTQAMQKIAIFLWESINGPWLPHVNILWMEEILHHLGWLKPYE
jgi:hypothetical protein